MEDIKYRQGRSRKQMEGNYKLTFFSLIGLVITIFVMDRTTLDKLLEIQYLKGRIDELYKGYVPNYTSTNNRIVDTRISKYENKLKETDELEI